MKRNCRNEKTDGVNEDEIITNQEQSDWQPAELKWKLEPVSGKQRNHKTKTRCDQFVSQKLTEIILIKSQRPNNETVHSSGFDFFCHSEFIHPVDSDPRNESCPKHVSKIVIFCEAADLCGLSCSKNRNPQSQFNQRRDNGLKNGIGEKIKPIFKICENGQAKEREIPSPKTGE